jgi:histidine triad (HIT) family protein
MADCIFCKIASGDIPATIVYENDDVVAFEDLNPAAPCHVLCIPRQHIATVNDVEDEHTAVLGKLYTAAKEVAARKRVTEDGYRLVMNCGEGAGQSVFHLHLHVLGGRDFAWPPG